MSGLSSSLITGSGAVCEGNWAIATLTCQARRKPLSHQQSVNSGQTGHSLTQVSRRSSTVRSTCVEGFYCRTLQQRAPKTYLWLPCSTSTWLLTRWHSMWPHIKMSNLWHVRILPIRKLKTPGGSKRQFEERPVTCGLMALLSSQSLKSDLYHVHCGGNRRPDVSCCSNPGFGESDRHEHSLSQSKNRSTV